MKTSQMKVLRGFQGSFPLKPANDPESAAVRNMHCLNEMKLYIRMNTSLCFQQVFIKSVSKTHTQFEVSEMISLVDLIELVLGRIRCDCVCD